MNREDIIRMAREADPDVVFDEFLEGTVLVFKRFAALVAAEERNRTWTKDHWTEYEKSIAAAERSLMAELVEQMGIDGYGTLAIAAAIRARGQS